MQYLNQQTYGTGLVRSPGFNEFFYNDSACIDRPEEKVLSPYLLIGFENSLVSLNNRVPSIVTIKNISIDSPKHKLSAFLGAWAGEDIDNMLDMVYKTRSKF